MPISANETQVFVPDTSIFNHLKCGTLTETIFQLPLSLTVSDIFYRNILKDSDGEYFQKLGLSIVEVPADGMQQVQIYRKQHNHLTFPDCLAFTLAQINQWGLLTECRQVQTLANKENIYCCNTNLLMGKIHS